MERRRPLFEIAGTDRHGPVEEKVVIQQGDALEKLRAMPAGMVDLVLTSPPYNIGMTYEDALPVADYVQWCTAWLQEIERVTTPTASVWLNLGYTEVPHRGKAVPIAYLLWPHIQMDLVQEVVWFFRAGVACRRRFSPRNEKLLWLTKDLGRYHFDLDAVRDPNVRYPNQRRNGRPRCNPAGRNPSDVWEIPRVTGGAGRRSPERTDHPAQMPLAVAERVILACSRPGDVVLDPFLGSGTTAEAALLHDRLCIGIELEDEYIAIATARVFAARR